MAMRNWSLKSAGMKYVTLDSVEDLSSPRLAIL